MAEIDASVDTFEFIHGGQTVTPEHQMTLMEKRAVEIDSKHKKTMYRHRRSVNMSETSPNEEDWDYEAYLASSEYDYVAYAATSSAQPTSGYLDKNTFYS